MTAATAKVPTYHLQLRLIDGAGVPFNDNEFRVTWGKDKLRGKTTADGIIDLVVDGAYGIQGGTLELGNVTAGAFVPSIVIPLKKHDGQSTAKVHHQDYGNPPGDEMSYDIGWRLANLMYLPWVPTVPTYGSLQSAPQIAPGIGDAVRRFKAHNHERLGLTDWLIDVADAETDDHPRFLRLRTVQDDESMKLLLMQHDNLSDADAGKKLDRAKSGVSASWAGEPL